MNTLIPYLPNVHGDRHHQLHSCPTMGHHEPIVRAPLLMGSTRAAEVLIAPRLFM